MYLFLKRKYQERELVHFCRHYLHCHQRVTVAALRKCQRLKNYISFYFSIRYVTKSYTRFFSGKIEGRTGKHRKQGKITFKNPYYTPPKPRNTSFQHKNSENLHFLQIFSEWNKVKLTILSGKQRDDKRENRETIRRKIEGGRRKKQQSKGNFSET